MFSERITILHVIYYLLPLNMYNGLASLNYIMLYGNLRWSVKFSTAFLDNASIASEKKMKSCFYFSYLYMSSKSTESLQINYYIE